MTLEAAPLDSDLDSDGADAGLGRLGWRPKFSSGGFSLNFSRSDSSSAELSSTFLLFSLQDPRSPSSIAWIFLLVIIRLSDRLSSVMSIDVPDPVFAVFVQNTLAGGR